MKLKGRDLSLPEPKEVKFVRGSEEFVFKVGPVLDKSKYAEAFPEPQPPLKKFSIDDPGVPVPTDPNYLEKMTTWNQNAMNWLFMQSLIQYTEGLEFTIVDPDNPETWSRFSEELENSGLLNHEIQVLYAAIIEVNRLTDKALQMAESDFLAQQLMEKLDS